MNMSYILGVGIGDRLGRTCMLTPACEFADVGCKLPWCFPRLATGPAPMHAWAAKQKAACIVVTRSADGPAHSTLTTLE